MLLLAWASFPVRWVASPRPLCSGRLSASGTDNGALCASAGPRRSGFEDGIGRGKQFLSYFQVQRDERNGKERRSPRYLPRREGAGSVRLHGEEVEALGGAGMCRCGSGWAICHQPCRHGPQAGATPAPRARLEESLTSSSDAPGSGQGWSREVLGWTVWELQTWGSPPQSYRFNLPTRGFAVVLGNAMFGAEKGTCVTCVLAGSSQLGLAERARPLLPPCPQPALAPPCQAVSGLVVSSPPRGIRECRSLALARMSEMI